jgi:tripartite-type tricarboxylate transporter receptor subunit TctC
MIVSRGLLPVLVALVLGAAGACAPAALAPPAAAPSSPAAAKPAAKPATRADYYAGKTVTVLVNYSAGGISDIFARMVARYLGNHIPDHPTVIVENKPGAGGAVGTNYLYNVARKDGLTLGAFSAFIARQVLDTEGTQYDAAQFHWLGGVSEPNFDVASQSLGITRAAELPRASGEVIVGGLAPDSPTDLHMRTFLNLLGVRYRYVTGYPGFPETRLAFQRGEISYRSDGLTGWYTWLAPVVRDGTVVPVAQLGMPRNGQVERDPRIAEIPTFHEVAQEVRGAEVRNTVEYRALSMLVQISALLRGVLAPPGTDAGLVALLREAVADTFADPEFRAEMERQVGYQVEFIPGPEAQAIAQRIIRESASDQEATEYLKRLTREKD